MAKGDYYFPFFYQRFLTSTQGWKDEEIGCYLRLLVYQFDKGSLPSDLQQLARIAPSVKKHWSLLKGKFIDNGKGGLVNEVMDDVRNEVDRMKEKNRENGKKGGRPKKSGGFLNGNPGGNPEITQGVTQTITQTKPILITNNQIESAEKSPLADLSKSNLFRQPKIPTKQQVLEAIVKAGGTQEMAKSFYLKHDSTGWFINGSPIINYISLAQKFVENWRKNDEGKEQKTFSSAPKLKTLEP